MRQARINIQNMIVFTVEFTRTPLSRRGKCVKTSGSAYITHWTRITCWKSQKVHTLQAADTGSRPPE
jgi:hypothetical protein